MTLKTENTEITKERQKTSTFKFSTKNDQNDSIAESNRINKNFQLNDSDDGNSVKVEGWEIHTNFYVAIIRMFITDIEFSWYSVIIPMNIDLVVVVVYVTFVCVLCLFGVYKIIL